MADALLWGGVAVAGLILAGILFWIAAKVVRAERASFGRAMLCALFCGIVAAAVGAMVFVLTAERAAARPGLVFYPRWLGGVLVFIASVVILRNGFETSFGRAIAVWCCAMGLAAMLGVLLMPVWAYLAAWLARLAPQAV